MNGTATLDETVNMLSAKLARTHRHRDVFVCMYVRKHLTKTREAREGPFLR